MGGNRETGNTGETAGKEEKQRGPRGVWGRRGGGYRGNAGGRGVPTSCSRYGNSLPLAPGRQKSSRKRFAFSGEGGREATIALRCPTAPR